MYGRKDKDHRTLLSKCVVWPPGVSSGEVDIEDFEIRHAVSHKEALIRKHDAVGAFTLECIYSENIRTYKQMRKFLSHKEKRDAWFEMRWIAGVDRPAADWKESLREAVFLWGAHNHLPEHFKQEYPHWPKYRYLVTTPPNNKHLLIKWEYPSLPSPLWYTSPLPSSDEDRAPTPPSPWIVQKDVYLIIIPACPQYLVITILFKLHFSASANTIKMQTAHRAVELSFTHLSHECETVHIKLPHEYPGLNSQPVNKWSYERLKTTFGWHMLPTWLAVRGTEFELAFLQQATITWALHWPEDIISSIVVPTGATTTWMCDKDTEGVHDVDFDFELNQLYGSMTYDEVEFAIESSNMAGARPLEWILEALIHFLNTAAMASDGCIPHVETADWAAEFQKAIFLWDIHNCGFEILFECWPYYKYLSSIPIDGQHRMVEWLPPMSNTLLQQ
ncbi:hypothetical protein F5879DRAFT_925744 [Lentinula edodes]|nr:hypothetical protein F5879DRAFT_925744 [Lentinula edodes]